MILLHWKWLMGALRLLFECYKTITLYYDRSMGAVLQASHTARLPTNTNQLIYHDLIFSASQEQGKLLIHKNYELRCYLIHLLWKVRNQ
jgi:hypothetical protein